VFIIAQPIPKYNLFSKKPLTASPDGAILNIVSRTVVPIPVPKFGASFFAPVSPIGDI
jgi:hypothetical protein